MFGLLSLKKSSMWARAVKSLRLPAYDVIHSI